MGVAVESCPVVLATFTYEGWLLPAQDTVLLSVIFPQGALVS